MRDGRPVTEAPRPVPPRTDPLAAALAFAIMEAVRLEAERCALSSARTRANVVAMKLQPEADAA